MFCHCPTVAFSAFMEAMHRIVLALFAPLAFVLITRAADSQAVEQPQEQLVESESQLKAKAMQGDVDAMASLASAYAPSEGETGVSNIERNYEAAYVWWQVFIGFTGGVSRGPLAMAEECRYKLTKVQITQAVAEMRSLLGTIAAASGKQPCYSSEELPVRYEGPGARID